MDNLTKAQTIAKAVEILEQPMAHAVGGLARLPSGAVCDPNDSAATSWCAIGALQRAGASDDLVREIAAFVQWGTVGSLYFSHDPIWQINDNLSINGPRLICEKMRAYVHQLVKEEKV